MKDFLLWFIKEFYLFFLVFLVIISMMYFINKSWEKELWHFFKSLTEKNFEEAYRITSSSFKKECSFENFKENLNKIWIPTKKPTFWRLIIGKEEKVIWGAYETNSWKVSIMIFLKPEDWILKIDSFFAWGLVRQKLIRNGHIENEKSWFYIFN